MEEHSRERELVPTALKPLPIGDIDDLLSGDSMLEPTQSEVGGKAHKRKQPQ